MKYLIVILVLSLITFHNLNATNFYVSTTGNDATGKGTQATPWLTIAKALTVIPADKNNTLFIGEGMFSISSQIRVPSGVNLIGHGIGKTYIKCENFFDISKTSKKGADWQIAPVLDPQVSATATLVFKGKNQTIKGINFNGIKKQTICPILIEYGENMVFDSIFVYDFKVSGWWLHEGKNVTLSNSRFQNNSFGNFNQDYGAVMFHRADDLYIHDNLIDESDTQSYGIKMASKDQVDMWSKKDKWNTKTVNDNINIYNNIIKVNENGSWGITENPDTKIPTFTIEFNSNIECRVKIYNNWLNNVISIVSGETNQKTSCEINNNLVDLRHDDGTLDRNSYFVEMDLDHFNIHHNLVIGGQYYLASFDDEKARNKDIKIHHNIFYGPSGGDKKETVFYFSPGWDGFQFCNNTVIDLYKVVKFFSGKNPERSNINTSFINNIFYSYNPVGYKLGDSMIVNGVIENNLFYNFIPCGDNSLIFNPNLKFSGLLTEVDYYSLNKGSKAIDAGKAFPSINNKFVGSAPDLGAVEYGIEPFKVGLQDYTGPKSIIYAEFNESDKYRRISVSDLKDKIEGGWMGQVTGQLFGAFTEAKWKTTIMPFGFDDFTKFDAELSKKAWEDGKTWDNMLIEVNKYKNTRANWHSYVPESTPVDDDFFLELIFLHSLKNKGTNITSRQLAEDWVAYLDSARVWAANLYAIQNLTKGIWPPESGMPMYNPYYAAIDFQIESEIFGYVTPGMTNASQKLSRNAGQIMAYDEGLDAGVAIAAITSEAFFESDPVKLMEHGIAVLPPNSKYGEMMRTILDGSKKYRNWEDLWTVIQDKNWRINETNMPYNVRIEGAYVFIGLLYGEGDFHKSMNIAMRCGEDSDCNPATTAGILGLVLGYNKLPEKWNIVRKLPVINTAIKTIYPKTFNWDRIIDETFEIAKWNIIQNGGFIDNGIVYIPVQQKQ